MKFAVLFLVLAGLAGAQGAPTEASKPSTPAVTTIVQAKRVYVEALAGNDTAEALRQLIIASLQQSHLFLVTDNADRADIILKGAANDAAFTDTFDTYDGASSHGSLGGSSGKLSVSKLASKSLAGAIGGTENDSEHIRERKHEAYATVRLCNRDGDVLWATTQESRGAKFRSASADVAEKISRQLQLDFAKASRDANQPAAPVSEH